MLIPDLEAGCSLAASITAADVRLLRQRYPGVPVVTYVNTSAAVKAESDICCTSGNARKVIESLGVDRVIMLPDEEREKSDPAIGAGKPTSKAEATNHADRTWSC